MRAPLREWGFLRPELLLAARTLVTFSLFNLLGEILASSNALIYFFLALRHERCDVLCYCPLLHNKPVNTAARSQPHSLGEFPIYELESKHIPRSKTKTIARANSAAGN